MRKRNPSHLHCLTLIIFLLVTLTACRAPAEVIASPITQLPSGTDGYPWWNDTVFYELFVRSFYDSDGDGIGDFNGIIEKLDYLNDGDFETTSDLGVTGLWLMPIFPSPSYHGYDVVDYYNVNPEFGTLEDFQRLVDEAHQRGIRVTIDLVINHTSSEHPWFLESQDLNSPKRDWYVWADKSPGYRGPWGQQVWYKLGDFFYYAVFWDRMPDLNLANPEVVAEIGNVTKFWLAMGVDGFRLDAAKHIVEENEVQENSAANHAFWKQFRTVFKAANPEAIAVGEVWSSTDAVKRYLEGDELDLAFEFDLAGAILDGIDAQNPFKTRLALEKAAASFTNLEFGTFLANHDQNRVMSRFLSAENQARLAASVLLTAPGVPFLYYGEEIGMSGAKPDENIRSPFHWNAQKNAGFTSADYPWRLVNEEYTQRNVAVMVDDPASLLSHYRTLINLRNQHAALRVGTYTEVDVEQSNVMAYLRASQDEQVLVVLNFNDKPLTELSLSLGAGPLTGEYKAVSMVAPDLWGSVKQLPALSASEAGGFNDYMPLAEGEALPGLGVAVIQLQPK